MVDQEELTIIAVEDSATELYGYSPEELMRMRFSDLHPKEDLSRLIAFFKNYDELNDESCWTQCSKDGALVETSISVSKVCFESRNAFICRVRQGRQRFAPALALRQRDERLRALFLNAVAGVAIIGPDGSLLEVNDAYCRMLGYSHPELVSLSIYNLLDEDVREEDQRLLDLISRRLRGPSVVERTYVGKTGTKIPARDSIAPTRHPDGTIEAFVRVTIDMSSERALASHLDSVNAQLRIASSSLRFGGWTLETSKSAVYLEEELQDLIDVGSPLLAVDDWLHLFQSGDGETLSESISACIQSEKSFDLNLTLRACGPTPLPVRIIGHPVRNPNAAIQQVQGVIFDLSREARHALDSASDLYDRDNEGERLQRMESLGMLVSGIAHDLNNLLAPISMGADLLKRKATDAGAASILASIGASARRGGELVKQVLEIAKGSDGGVVLLQLDHIIHEVEDILTSTFPSSIRFTTSPTKELWPIRGDPSKLYQVILNLCVNARDAMTNGGRLTISTCNFVVDEFFSGPRHALKPGPYILLEVADEGCGISPEMLGHVFDPFFTSKGHGTGLGLSTVATIIHSHHGFIDVDSKLGKGTVFRVYLPAQPGDERNSAAALGNDRPDPEGSGETILLVDDEEAILDITRQTLEPCGYNVIVARNGAEAIAAYARDPGKIALVILDWMMPVMDGKSLVCAIQNIDPRQALIITTGGDLNSLYDKIDSNDSCQIIPKPFAAGVLLTLVRRQIDSSRR